LLRRNKKFYSYLSDICFVTCGIVPGF
jgi:hypothetical protein